MSEINTSQNDWTACQPGALGRFASRQKSRNLRAKITLAGGMVSVCLLCVFAWNLFFPPTSSYKEPNYGGIVCSKVKAMGKAHLAGSLDEQTSRKIERHLTECGVCRSFMDRIQNGQVSTPNPVTYPSHGVSVIATLHAVP